ncbi:MAG: Type 1 glutamine amidotransferase-like domain-containing protein [Patescibacteria group bacterium]
MTIEALYLSGGGDEVQTAAFDALYTQELEARGIKNIVYIPVALKPDRFSKAEEWFQSVFSGKVEGIKTLTELNNVGPLDPKEQSIYIGGGDTVRLLKGIKDSGFDKTLIWFIRNGGIVYGGSAGAIILGADIRTAPETNNITLPSYEGLNLLNGMSVACHYDGSEDEHARLKKLRNLLDIPIIALPENAGVIIRSEKTEIVGENVIFI